MNCAGIYCVCEFSDEKSAIAKWLVGAFSEVNIPWLFKAIDTEFFCAGMLNACVSVWVRPSGIGLWCWKRHVSFLFSATVPFTVPRFRATPYQMLFLQTNSMYLIVFLGNFPLLVFISGKRLGANFQDINGQFLRVLPGSAKPETNFSRYSGDPCW